MNPFLSIVRQRLGATAIEYALIATLISIVAYAFFVSIGQSVSGMFGSVGSSL